MLRPWTATLSAGVLCLGFAVLSGTGGEQPEIKDKPRADPFEQVVKSPEHVKIALELRTATTTVKMGQPITWSAELVNEGKQEVTLVQPGDGSDCAWRTPLVQWRINGSGPKGDGARCGNINSLRPKEVFTLKPGQRAKLGEWIGSPAFAGAGKYQVSLRYLNIPDLNWSGLPLGKHDEATMKQVRGSTPVAVTSNVIEITVTK